jgi:hypothetical protein
MRASARSKQHIVTLQSSKAIADTQDTQHLLIVYLPSADLGMEDEAIRLCLMIKVLLVFACLLLYSPRVLQ